MVNCAFFGCCTNRNNVSETYKGISLFKITNRKGEYYENWRKEVVNILTTSRVVDGSLKHQIETNTVYICEKHYKPEDIEISPKGRKILCPGALPTENHPSKSHQSVAKVTRRHIDIVQDHPIKEKIAYQNIEQLKRGIEKSALKDWIKNLSGASIVLKLHDSNFDLPKYAVVIEADLTFHVAVYNWKLPVDHVIYTENKQSMRCVKVSYLLRAISDKQICEGIPNQLAVSECVCHVLPKTLDFKAIEPFQFEKFYRSKSCQVLIPSAPEPKCKQCESLQAKLHSKQQSEKIKSQQCLKTKAPLSQSSASRLLATLLQERFKCSQLEEKVKEMSKEIVQASIKIDDQLSVDLDQLMEQNISQASPFMKLFWKEQVRNFSQRSKRYHPMVIRFCLSMASKSGSMYDELRSSGILCLPSKRTLRDYRNVIPPKTGFIPEVIDQLKKSTENLSGHQRYVCIAFDEMKISSGLVFDKNSGEIVGFISLGDDQITEASMGKENNLASHALLFSVRGISCHLCFPMAYFATDAIISTQLIALFWRCVAILELNCNLWVIATVCDGATANRKFFSLHKSLDREPTGSDVVYRTINIFCRSRYIFFISDAPHLMKTARNCLLNSGSGNKSRCMWFKDQFILWRHIADIYNKDLESGLKLLPRLSNAHIQLTSYSKMKVSLACQVLSESVATVLKNFSPKECMATATFCEVFDKFFDCLNVRSLKESQTKRKPYTAPYTSINDERFHWLKDVFLQFFNDWKSSIESREGNFSKLEKEKMFISKQTHVGLQTTVLAVVECVKFLLSNGMPYVLTERFNQDSVEEYFGQQRSIGRRSDNPTIQQFGYNANIIRTQRFASTRTGNTSGKYKGLKRQSAWYYVDDEPLDRRQKKKN